MHNNNQVMIIVNKLDGVENLFAVHNNNVMIMMTMVVELLEDFIVFYYYQFEPWSIFFLMPIRICFFLVTFNTYQFFSRLFNFLIFLNDNLLSYAIY